MTTDRQTIRYPGITRICRGIGSAAAGNGGCGNAVGTVAAPQPAVKRPHKASTTPPVKNIERYVDELPASHTDVPGDFIYAVEVMNDRGRSAGFSNKVRVPAAATLPPPDNFAAKVTAGGVALSWIPVRQPATISGLHYLYRIYRREESGETSSIAGEVPLGKPANNNFVDHDFQWEKKYSYYATVVTLIDRAPGPEAQVEGDNSPAVSVFTHDVFPPAAPSGLQAVFSGDSQHFFIDLIWDANTENDLAGYNIFRHEEGGAVVKINSELVKLPAFRDMNVSAEKKYYYSVSAVDIRGNESARSEEASERVP